MPVYNFGEKIFTEKQGSKKHNAGMVIPISREELKIMTPALETQPYNINR